MVLSVCRTESTWRGVHSELTVSMKTHKDGQKSAVVRDGQGRRVQLLSLLLTAGLLHWGD